MAAITNGGFQTSWTFLVFVFVLARGSLGWRLRSSIESDDASSLPAVVDVEQDAAADGSLVANLHGEITAIPSREGDPEVAATGDHRDRGPALLQPRWRGPTGYGTRPSPQPPRVRQGGSTITQQSPERVLHGRPRTLLTKANEAVVAWDSNGSRRRPDPQPT